MGAPRITYRSLLAAVAVVTAVAVVGLAVLLPREGLPVDDDGYQPSELVDATLVQVERLPDDGLPGLLPGAVPVEVTARIDDTAELVTFETTDDTGELFRAGQRVKLSIIEQPDLPPTYLISDFRRDRPLLLLLALFLGAVVAFGRLQGLRALVGLVLTFLLIVLVIVPAILQGSSPVPVAVFGALLIMVVTLYLSHGVGRKTTAAVVGTSLALLLTGGLAALFVQAANITGFTSEEARLAALQVGGLSLRGLLLAGIIIGGLGVLDDVTMSQASTVFELHRANPEQGFGHLVGSALTVGRDHIAATVNTLFLAYAGASLPLLILFSTSVDTLPTILTSEIVAVEVIRTLVGSVGLIAAVPLTTALAAALALADPAGAAREADLGHGGHGHQARGTTSTWSAVDPAQDVERQAGGSTSSRSGIAGEPAPDQPPENQPLEEWEVKLRSAYRLPEQGGDDAPAGPGGDPRGR